MAQLTAGEIIALELDGARLRVKIEDASKSDVFLARVESVDGDADSPQIGQVREFNRALLTATPERA